MTSPAEAPTLRTLVRIPERPAPAPITPPPSSMRGHVLREGAVGEGVEWIRQRLRANGYDVALTGPFDRELDRVVRVFQARNHLDNDGKVGNLTRAALASPNTVENAGDRARRQQGTRLTQGGAVVVPGNLPPPRAPAPGAHPAPVAGPVEVQAVAPTRDAAALQSRIRDLAFGEIGTVNYSRRGTEGGAHGWQHLQHIFSQSTGFRPKDDAIRNNAHPGNPPIHWCGMFATYVWQEAGINTHWKWGVGPQGPEVVNTMRPWRPEQVRAFEQSVQVGDILVGPGPNWHHSLVVDVAADGTITTVDGNTVALNPSRGGELTGDITRREGDLPVANGDQPALSHGIAMRRGYDRGRITKIIRPRALVPSAAS